MEHQLRHLVEKQKRERNFSSNEMKLSHRWRRQAWQTSGTASYNQICAIVKASGGSSAWLDLGELKVEQDQVSKARLGKIRRRHKPKTEAI
jgi:hypothetical protein